jgi:lantibiotic modifying enzyme
MDQRHLVIDSPHMLSVGDTDGYLGAAFEDIVANFPPRSRYPHEALHGLWSGPTGVAYLLLRASAIQPGLTIRGHSAGDWAQQYIAPGSRGHNLRLGSHGCGIGDEKLAFDAVRSAISKNLQDVRQLMSSIAQIMTVQDYPDEMLYGRAGTLYLLRMVRHWVPGSNSLVDPAIAEISNTIMNRGPRWRWHGRRYLGAVHGDIGIVTQLVLTSPSLASRLQPVVESLLAMQQPDGNWPSSEESSSGGKGLVQFCHGAPGFVLSLLAIRSCFPDLRDRFDAAIKKGRECVWTQGLLKKEPSLCHGIFGNAL